jgi:hypothetical protein
MRTPVRSIALSELPIHRPTCRQSRFAYIHDAAAKISSSRSRIGRRRSRMRDARYSAPI